MTLPNSIPAQLVRIEIRDGFTTHTITLTNLAAPVRLDINDDTPGSAAPGASLVSLVGIGRANIEMTQGQP